MNDHLNVTQEGFVWYVLDGQSALSLWSCGSVSIYVLRDDNTEVMVDSREDLVAYLSEGAVFGIEVGHIADIPADSFFNNLQEISTQAVVRLTDSRDCSRQEAFREIRGWVKEFCQNYEPFIKEGEYYEAVDRFIEYHIFPYDGDVAAKLNRIKSQYDSDKTEMNVLLSSNTANGLTLEEAFKLYVEAMSYARESALKRQHKNDMWKTQPAQTGQGRETVKYGDEEFPIRRVQLLNGEQVTVSVERLARVLIDADGSPVSAEASRLDDTIFYYLDEESFKAPDTELSQQLSNTIM